MCGVFEGVEVVKSETLRGVALVHKLRELESQNVIIKSVAVGRTNAEYILEWHERPEYQTSIVAEPFPQAQNPEALPGSNRRGHDGRHHAGSHSPGASHLSGGEGPAGNQ